VRRRARQLVQGGDDGLRGTRERGPLGEVRGHRDEPQRQAVGARPALGPHQPAVVREPVEQPPRGAGIDAQDARHLRRGARLEREHLERLHGARDEERLGRRHLTLARAGR
jgi:hypothetical protein